MPQKLVRGEVLYICEPCSKGTHGGANHQPGICDCACRPDSIGDRLAKGQRIEVKR